MPNTKLFTRQLKKKLLSVRIGGSNKIYVPIYTIKPVITSLFPFLLLTYL